MKTTLLLALVWIGALPAHAEPTAKPNIIVVLVDDMGWTDLSSFGSHFYQTPNIDRLAAAGMKFTQAYAACTVCSPTRAALLTGKVPARLHLTDWIAGHVRPFAKLKVPDWTMHLPLEEMNLAKALKPAGYASASIGKWHLGNEEFFPDKQGFDLNVAGCERGQPPSYFSPYRIATLPDGPPGEFLTDRLTEETLHFIEQNRERPFFVYLPQYAVHMPLMAKPEAIEKYRRVADPQNPQHNPVYAALIESVDESVGRIVAKLEELKLTQRTIIVFTSDNGGLMEATSNAPLRRGKGSAYEGGVRVPMIVKWPGITVPGSVCETPVMSVDFFPTLLEMAGVAAPGQEERDGESLVPLLRQSGTLARKSLYWHYPHYHPGGATPHSAVRNGDWKLIEFFEDEHVELYNLKDDVGEAHDLAAQLPEQTARLRAELTQWRLRVGAQLPSVNPDFDPLKDEAQRNHKSGAKGAQAIKVP